LDPLLERALPLRDELDLAALEARLVPDDDDLAREEAVLRAPPVDFDPLLPEREPVPDRAAVLRDLDADAPDFEALPPDFEPLARDEEDEDFARDEPLLEPELRAAEDLLDPLLDELDPEPLASVDHLPLITRCAASATASAMIEPSLVALDTMLLAACDAVSAASRPASRIFLRAAGLALIAAAAAARPAASISLLIAALASLSTELSLDPEREELDFEELEREELFRADLAICCLPPLRGKDTLMPFRFPNEVGSGAIQTM
jgi:hypothetical protein